MPQHELGQPSHCCLLRVPGNRESENRCHDHGRSHATLGQAHANALLDSCSIRVAVSSAAATSAEGVRRTSRPVGRAGSRFNLCAVSPQVRARLRACSRCRCHADVTTGSEPDPACRAHAKSFIVAARRMRLLTASTVGWCAAGSPPEPRRWNAMAEARTQIRAGTHLAPAEARITLAAYATRWIAGVAGRPVHRPPLPTVIAQATSCRRWVTCRSGRCAAATSSPASPSCQRKASPQRRWSPRTRCWRWCCERRWSPRTRCWRWCCAPPPTTGSSRQVRASKSNCHPSPPAA